MMLGSRRRRSRIPPPEYNAQGQLLCRVCRKVVEGRGVYCGSKCRDAFLIRRRPEYAAMRVRQDHGNRCVRCGADEIECFERYQQAVALLAGTPCEGLILEFQMWQVDHERPVSDGGGECGLENLRLLCPLCHGGVTAVLMEERKARVGSPSAWQARARAEREYRRGLPPGGQSDGRQAGAGGGGLAGAVGSGAERRDPR